MKGWKHHVWAMVYVLLLSVFTAYVLLDTFVIVRIYNQLPQGLALATAQAQLATVTSAPTEETAEPVITETAYQDENITISLKEYQVADTRVYVAEVLLSSPEYLQSAFAQHAYGRNVTATTSEIAQEVQAILAINGDFYGSRESGYVHRNGVLYRDTPVQGQMDLVIYQDGTFGIIQEDKVTADALLASGAAQVLSFGPVLVQDGEVTVSASDEVGKAMTSNPRTAIGIIETGHYLFVVSDGRTQESVGLSLLQLGDFMVSLGAKTVYNLDGGGSSTMVFLGRVVNQPTTNGRTIQERSVSDIAYIGY